MGIQVYKVGEEFPANNYADGNEKAIVSFHQSFFDLQIYLVPKKDDIKALTKGPIKYGLFNYQSVPFFLIDFLSTISFDASLNFLKVKEEAKEDWLNSEANLLNIYVIHAESNELLGMRTIGLRKNFCEQIRDILEEQEGKYANPEEVDKAIAAAIGKYSNNIMIANGNMIRL